VSVKSGVKVGTFSGIVAVSGAVATIKLDQATPVKDQVYTLTIPAGTFRDAAGNLNALYTAPVTFANGKTPPPPPVNGTCGSANGSAFEIAPTANLCTAGTASVVTGVGPYYWSCAGIDLGTTASCSAQYKAPANNTDVTPPAVVSVVTNGGPTSNSFTVSITFTEGIVFVKSGVKVGTFSGNVTVSGAVATIRLDQASPVKGQAYTLTVPAGTFRDAAGNLNTLYSASVVFANGKNPPPTDVTPPTVVSTVVTGATISSDVIKVTFTEAVTSTNKTIMIGTAQTTYTVGGSAVSFKIKSCCLTKVKVGNTYNLVIPAGSFKDAAGNLNAAITVAVKL
jgi:hypothetical protein